MGEMGIRTIEIRILFLIMRISTIFLSSSTVKADKWSATHSTVSLLTEPVSMPFELQRRLSFKKQHITCKVIIRVLNMMHTAVLAVPRMEEGKKQKSFKTNFRRLGLKITGKFVTVINR